MNIECINLIEIDDFFIMNQMTTYELRENFKLLKTLIAEYQNKLNKLLVLSRPMDLNEFFIDVEKKILLFTDIFQQIKDRKIKNKIIFYIKQIKTLNNKNINLFLATRKK